MLQEKLYFLELSFTSQWNLDFFLSKLRFSTKEVISQTLYVSPLVRVFSQNIEDVDLDPPLKKEALNLSPLLSGQMCYLPNYCGRLKTTFGKGEAERKTFERNHPIEKHNL